MRKSICFTALTAILLVMLSALMLSLVSCKEEPAEKFSVNFIVDGTEYESIATDGEERISIPASPSKEYYTFDGWYRDKDVWNDTFTADSLADEKLTADISVYARFIPVEYKATFKAGDTVVAEIPFTIETESITPPAVPELDGYTGGAWESFTLGTENITVNAVYTAITYKITYNNVDGAINKNPSEYDVEDETIVLGAATKLNYIFTGWYSDPEFNNRVTKILTSGMEDIQLYAKWHEGIAISTADELKNISMNGNYVLTGNIDLGGAEWTPIGTGKSPFTGSLDGNGYKITNFKITTGMNHVGLFGYSSGTLLNLGVEDFEIDVTYSKTVCAGGLVGYNYIGTISNCYATGDVSATSSYSSCAGGLVGYNDNYYGAITNCYATGDVSATFSSTSSSSSSYSYAGGLVGYNNKGTITNCYATGDVSATSSSSFIYAGGLVGYDNDHGTITNCYATGDVSATSSGSSSTYSNCGSYAGGLVGYNSSQITKCYAMGDVSATSSGSSSTYSYAGGLVGKNHAGTITNCYATGDVSATSSSTSSDSSTYSYAGGLVGYNYARIITNCYATGGVSATSSGSRYSYSYAGGLVGYNSGTITNCYATGAVSATSSYRYSYAGGLVGYNNNGTITNCYATGAVSATSSSTSSDSSTYSYAGGLVGYKYYGKITNCYATGDVSASSSSSHSYSSSDAGGLVGYNSGTITNCYRYSGQSFTVTKGGTTAYSATNTEGAAKTMEDLKSSRFQTDTLGWSADDWTFTEGEHPVLKNVGLAE